MDTLGQGNTEPSPRSYNRAMREGVEIGHDAPARDEGTIRTARIHEGADDGGNDRRTRTIWAAGFLDGEGCIAVSSNRAGRASKSLILSLQATQVNPAPLHRLAELLGGTVRPRAGGSHRRAFYSWKVAGSMAAAALRLLEPFLVNKGEEARLALTFQSTLHRRSPGRALDEWENAERDSFRLALMEAHAFTWG